MAVLPSVRMLIPRLGWAMVAAIATLLLQSLLHHPIGIAPIVIVSALALLTAVRPIDGLLAVAAIGPLSTMLFAVIASEPYGIRFYEALVLAFLAGYAARHVIRPRSAEVPTWVAWSTKVLIAGALASAIVSVAILLVEDPTKTIRDVFQLMIVRDYLVNSTPFSFAMQFAEGLVVVLVVSDTCAGELSRRDAVLRMMVLGAAAAALMNVLRIVTAAVGQADPGRAFLFYLVHLRVNVHFADFNAAGSYFAMTTFFAAGLASRARTLSAIAVPLIAIALWLSGSRIALAAALLTATVVVGLKLLSRSTHRLAYALVTSAIVGLIVLGLWKWYPAARNATVSEAFAFRVEMGRAGIRLTSDSPVFGIGLGSFQRMAARYAVMPENAHNNYIQIMAELGIPGLVLFLVMVFFALREKFRDSSLRARSWGLLAGLAAFLLTALAGHPLLVPGSAYPFWIALGIAASPVSRPVPLRSLRLAGIALVTAIVATLPLRIIAAPKLADVENTSAGFSPSWQKRADGMRYRWAGGRSTFFVLSSARAVRIPLCSSAEGPPTIEVRIFANGRQIDGVLLRRTEDCRTVRFLPPRVSERFTRIDLEVRLPGASAPIDIDPSDTSGALMVGRPIIDY